MTRNRFNRDLNSFFRKNISFQFVAIFALIFGLNACYNEPNMVGGDLIPSEDKSEIFVSDTFKVSAYTANIKDSLSTSFFSYAVLGCDNSDIFGKIKADFMTEFTIDNVADTFHRIKTPERPIDSVFLELYLKRTWGKKNQPINIKIYRANYDIFVRNDSNKLFINGLNPITPDKYFPTVVSEPTVYSGGNKIRIRLNDDFENFFKNLPDSAFFSNTVLQRYFKGLYVTSDDYANNDGVLYFFQNQQEDTDYNLKENIRLVINHKRQVTRNGVTFMLDTVFNFDSYPAAKYNHYEHDYTKAEAGLKINHFYDTTSTAVNVEDSVFYIDGLGGTRGLIKLKGIESWKKLMPVAIHKAVLKFDVQSLQSHPEFPEDSIIPRLYYYQDRVYSKYNIMSSDDVTKILDFLLTESYSVNYNKASKYYAIDITLQLQNLLKNKISEDYFYLEPSDYKYNYRQGIFRTGNNSKPMKLIITYSKL